MAENHDAIPPEDRAAEFNERLIRIHPVLNIGALMLACACPVWRRALGWPIKPNPKNPLPEEER